MKKILIVDDDRELTSELSEILADQGFSIDRATNGPEGERMISANTYKAAIIDFKMPGFDGIELLKKIKHKDPQIKVIMISGSLDIQKLIEEKRIRPLVDYTMQKPFDVEEMIQKIKEISQ